MKKVASEIVTEQKSRKVVKALKYLKIAAFIAIIGGLVLFIALRYPDFFHVITDREAFSAFLAENQDQNALLYFLIVLVTVVLGFPAGQAINFVGGYVFGIALAYGLSIAGTALGTLVTFNLARHFGRDFVAMLFREKNVEKFVKMMDTSRAFVVIVLIYLIPGFPKDLFTYAAGLTSIRAIPFVLTAAAARSPGMLATLLFAAFLRNTNYIGMAAVVAIVAAFLVLVVIKRKKLFAYLETLHEKFQR